MSILDQISNPLDMLRGTEPVPAYKITIDGKDILVVVSGKKADELRTGQTIVNYPKEVTKCDGDDCPNQGKISQGSSGQIITTLNKKSNSGSSRQSWRQIR